MKASRHFGHISPTFLGMRNAAELQRRSKHILCSTTFFFLENRVAYEIMWKNTVEPDRPQMTIWRKNIACWIPNATNTYSEYEIVIAFLLQQWLHEHACLLCINYTSELPNTYAYDHTKR